jgi:hypothetical protein
MIVISIALSDIPKEAIKQADNGKKYASFVIDERREPDQFGNTHSVAINQTKEERASKAKKVYVGNGKNYVFEQKENTAKSNISTKATNDLPF